MAASNSRQKLVAIAAVIIVLLLAINAYLLINNINKGNQIEEQAIELQASQQLTDSLNMEYDMAIEELDMLKGTNEELNEVIEQQKAELTTQKNKIAGLIKNKKDLSRAREEIKNLTQQVDEYIAEVTRLKDENEQLSSENQSLQQNLTASQMENEELSTARATLAGEKAQLEDKTAKLAAKVNIASVVKVDGIEAKGFKFRGEDKKVEKKYARNIELLEVCFNATANKVTDPGVEKYFVRIINPTGETIAVDDMGSGIMRSQELGDDVRYTKIIEKEYNKEEQRICMEWEPNTDFVKGNYNVEVYNKGYLAGKGTFRLK